MFPAEINLDTPREFRLTIGPIMPTFDPSKIERPDEVLLKYYIFSEWIERSMKALRARTLPISNENANEAYSLQGTFHRDPADRLLVAAARCMDFVLLTADKRILAYNGARSRDAWK